MRQSGNGCDWRGHVLAGSPGRPKGRERGWRMTRRDEHGDARERECHATNDDERPTLPHLVVAAWAQVQLGVGVGGAANWWCAACQTQKGRADVRLEIEGREARHVCRGCGLVLDREEIPF
jgi:hypothetical protein